jgi:hypothetical protein
MIPDSRFTYVLLALVGLTALVSLNASSSAHNHPGLAQGNNRSRTRRDEADVKRQYPTVDYNEVEPTEPAKAEDRRAKQKRYNGSSFVGSKVHPEYVEIDSIPEGRFDFPALPVDRSDAIVLVDVSDGRAHLAEDKHNIYSEFTVHLDSVFKGETPRLVRDSQIIVDRVGGFVNYPDGRKILYRVAGYGMPRVGGRYVLFLNSIHENNDYSILTGYELTTSGVVPLDDSNQFYAYAGHDEATFLKALNDALKPSPAPGR